MFPDNLDIGTVFEDPSNSRVAICPDCYSVRGYWHSNGVGKNGIWVSIRRYGEKCKRCGSVENFTVHRNDGCLAILEES